MGVQFAGNILVQSNGGPLPISEGGTGQTTAPTAINALLPVQTGNSGKVLTTNGTNVSWSTSAGGGTPGGSDTQIQFNDAGTFNGSSNFVINKTTGALTAASTLTTLGALVSGAAETNRAVQFQTAGSNRWILQANATAESGASAGSNFELVSVADNGATQNQALTISRATRVVDFKVAPTLNGSAFGTYSAGTGIDITTGTITNIGVTSAVAGTNISVSGATGAVTISVTGTVPSATTATTATTATNLAGAQWTVPYQSNTDTTTMLALGASGHVLTSNGVSSAPSWAAVSVSGSQTGITSVGTLTSLAVTGSITKGGLEVGYLTVPQNAQNTPYTCVAADSGKHIYTAAGGGTWTIPANSSVAYAIGTAITFVNQSGTAVTIAITTDTMYLAGAGTAGSRTLGAYGMATALKVAATTWIISGTGLT